MKGLRIERAKPSNAIDIYALLKDMASEGLIHDKPSDRALKAYYFGSLLDELASPGHMFFVAKRGRGYLGFVHGMFISPWGNTKFIVNHLFVVKHRRKMGIGKKLLDALKKEIENNNVKRVEFSCPIDQKEYWEKKRKAQEIEIIMGVDL